MQELLRRYYCTVDPVVHRTIEALAIDTIAKNWTTILTRDSYSVRVRQGQEDYECSIQHNDKEIATGRLQPIQGVLRLVQWKPALIVTRRNVERRQRAGSTERTYTLSELRKLAKGSKIKGWYRIYDCEKLRAQLVEQGIL